MPTRSTARSMKQSAKPWCRGPKRLCMEQDLPLLLVSWDKINDSRYNYVKGYNRYNYSGGVRRRAL